MAEEQVSLYSDWKKLYPKYQPGFFRRLKWLAMALSLGIYYFLPFLRWERAGDLPRQAILLDLPNRKFYFFDLVIWPQDVILLAFLLMGAAYLLFFVTALAGRVFCGYLCFQTLWTDLFLQVERWVEGERNQRMKLDRAPWGMGKLGRKLLKHGLWGMISIYTGATFVFYFADIFEMAGQFIQGEAPYPAWFTMFFLASTTYVFAGLAREQVCIFMCPYARFQGVMFDSHTLTVAYDEERGEPRVASRRIRTAEEGKHGDCIDCRECVRVCPMDIDIRDGQQYQCTTCAACVDACDSVMERVNKPRGLIRYTSLEGLVGRPTRIIRPRVLIYGALVVLAFGIMAWYLIFHATVELNVIRQRTPLYIMQSDGAVQNNYTLRVLNMSAKEQTYFLEVTNLPGYHLEVGAVQQRDPAGHPLLTVGSGDVTPYTVYLRQAADQLAPGVVKIDFLLKSLSADGGIATYHSVFMRP